MGWLLPSYSMRGVNVASGEGDLYTRLFHLSLNMWRPFSSSSLFGFLIKAEKGLSTKLTLDVKSSLGIETSCSKISWNAFNFSLTYSSTSFYRLTWAILVHICGISKLLICTGNLRMVQMEHSNLSIAIRNLFSSENISKKEKYSVQRISSFCSLASCFYQSSWAGSARQFHKLPRWQPPGVASSMVKSSQEGNLPGRHWGGSIRGRSGSRRTSHGGFHKLHSQATKLAPQAPGWRHQGEEGFKRVSSRHLCCSKVSLYDKGLAGLDHQV